jgi:hypothetical protein
MKKTLLIGIILLSQGLMASTAPTSQPKMQSQELSVKQLAKQNKKITKLAAEEMNKTLPQKVDKFTELIRVSAKDTTLEYLFEINTGAKSDEAVRTEDHARMEKAITEGVCRSSKRFLDAQINISYIYRSATSKSELFRFDITQQKCL